MKNRLTSGEWEIYECLWETSPLTLAQIRRRHVERTGQSTSTAETVLSRMAKKGLVRVEQGKKAKLFYPLFPREEAVMEETHSFVEKMYHGSPLSLVNAMVNSGQLSDKDINDLYQLLEKELDKRND